MRFNGVEVTHDSLVVLAAASLGTLSCGTNYVVGSYAPQLKERLHLTVAQINLVASCGNFGVYLTGPFFGYLADRKGPRSLFVAGSMLLGLGYLGLFWSYETGDPESPESSVPLPLLALFSFITGLGSALGSTAGLNAVARAFVPATRGLAMGIVVSMFGLSAFFYASISALVIGDNTGLFLLVLAIGTFASLFGGSLFLNKERMESTYSIIPGGSPRENERALPRHSRSRSSASAGSAGERDYTDIEEMYNFEGGGENDNGEEEVERGRTTRSNSNGSNLSAPASSRHNKKSSILIKQAGEAIKKYKQDNILVETGTFGLFRIFDYYLLMFVMFCCTGTGIMWINSVGTVVVTLAEYNKIGGKVTLLQSHQTSLLSIFKLFVGAASDQVRTRIGIKPVWCLVFTCTCFIISQFLARASENLHTLAWATSLVGFSYGQFFGLAPIVMLDWFGLKSFSANMGTLYVIPTFSSYTFSYLFGKIYDNSTPPSSPDILTEGTSKLASGLHALLRRAGSIGHAHICPLGRECYSGIFSYTIPACVLALIVSIVLSLRRGKGLERHEALVLDEEEFLAEVEH